MSGNPEDHAHSAGCRPVPTELAPFLEKPAQFPGSSQEPQVTCRERECRLSHLRAVALLEKDPETPSPGWEEGAGVKCIRSWWAVAEDSLLQFPPLGAGPTGPLETGAQNSRAHTVGHRISQQGWEARRPGGRGLRVAVRGAGLQERALHTRDPDCWMVVLARSQVCV